jgi:hypothetical protein
MIGQPAPHRLLFISHGRPVSGVDGGSYALRRRSQRYLFSNRIPGKLNDVPARDPLRQYWHPQQNQRDQYDSAGAVPQPGKELVHAYTNSNDRTNVAQEFANRRPGSAGFTFLTEIKVIGVFSLQIRCPHTSPVKLRLSLLTLSQESNKRVETPVSPHEGCVECSVIDKETRTVTKNLAMTCFIALATCGLSFAQTAPSLIKVTLEHPMMVGSVAVPAGDCTVSVLRGSGDSSILLFTSSTGAQVAAIANRLHADTNPPGRRPGVVLQRRGDFYRLDHVWLSDILGFQVLQPNGE